MAAFIKKAQMVAAGPLMVIDTEVDGSQRSKPLYSFLASSRVQTDTPLLPILPYMSGLTAGSSPYSVTESKAVESRLAGKPSET